MKIKVHTIDLEMSRSAKRRLVFGGVLAVGLAAAVTVHATVPNTFQPGDLLTANAINANFADLDARISHPLINVGGSYYSIGAKYCGRTTAPTTGTISGGYPGARAACQAVSSCGTLSAHMCSAEEMLRSAQLGLLTSVPIVWYSTGARDVATVPIADCLGWTNASASVQGAIWEGSPNTNVCSASYPIACCD